MRGPRIITGVLALFVAGVLVGATSASTSGSAAGGYKLVGKWGKVGTGNGQFASAANGMTTDKAGNVYVADTDNNRVQVFSKSGAFLRKWGSIGAGNGQFAGAEDVAVSPDGTVWVADRGNQRVQAFSGAGAFKTSIAIPNELPQGVSVDVDGNVYVSGEGGRNGGYRVFSGSGTPSGGLTGAGNYRADAIAVSPDGTVFMLTSATQTDDDRVRHLSSDGKLLASWKLTRGDGTRGLGVDGDCNVWVGDVSQGGVSKYSPSGKKLATMASITGGYVAKDIAVGPAGDIYVMLQNSGVVRYAEDKAKPGRAAVPKKITVSKGTAKISYTASFGCPNDVSAVATLAGGGVSGKAAVKVTAGKKTVIMMKVKAPAGTSTKATFKIVLKTNVRPTTETASVTVVAR